MTILTALGYIGLFSCIEEQKQSSDQEYKLVLPNLLYAMQTVIGVESAQMTSDANRIENLVLLLKN